MSRSAFVYVHCPVTHQRIREPFQRHSGPVAFVHRPSKRKPIRMIVWPDPQGHEHRAWKIPDDQSLEDAINEAVREWQGRAA